MRQEPAPERSPERLDPALGKAGKEVADRVGAGKPGNPQHGMQRLVASQPIGVCKPARPGDHREKKRGQGLRGRDRVGTSQLEDHRLLQLRRQADAPEKLDQAHQPAKGRNRLLGAA